MKKIIKWVTIVVGGLFALTILGTVVTAVVSPESLEADEPVAEAEEPTPEPKQAKQEEEPKKQKQAKQEEKPKKEEAAPEPEPKPRDELQQAIEDAVDDAETKFRGGDVVVTFPISDNLTKGMIRTGAQSDTLYIIEAVKSSDYKNGQPTLVVNGTFPMVDQYGNESDDEILNALYLPEDIAQINVENMLHENVWEVATEKFVHPELQE